MGKEDDSSSGVSDSFEFFRILYAYYLRALYTPGPAPAEPDGFGDDLSEMEVEVFEDALALLFRFFGEGLVNIVLYDFYPVAHDAAGEPADYVCIEMMHTQRQPRKQPQERFDQKSLHLR